MSIKIIEYNGISGYARVMYNDVKEANKHHTEVAYEGKDVKALLEYLFELEEKNERLNNIRNNTIDFCNRYLSLNLDDFNADKLLKKIIEIQGDDKE